jgi:hypothetical protein
MPVYFPTTAPAVFWVTSATGKDGVEFEHCTVEASDLQAAREAVEQARQTGLYPSNPALKTLLKDAVRSTPDDFVLRIQEYPCPELSSGPASISGKSFQGAIYLGFLVENMTRFVKAEFAGFEKWDPMIVVSARVVGIELAKTDEIDLKWKAACRLAKACGSERDRIRFCYAGHHDWRPGTNPLHPLEPDEQAGSKFLIPRRIATLPELVQELFDDYQEFARSKLPPPSSMPPAAEEPRAAPTQWRKAWWLGGTAAALAAAALAVLFGGDPAPEPAKVASGPATASTVSPPPPAPEKVVAPPLAVTPAPEPVVSVRVTPSKSSKSPAAPKPSIGMPPPTSPVDAEPAPVAAEPPIPQPVESAPPARAPRRMLAQPGE